MAYLPIVTLLDCVGIRMTDIRLAASIAILKDKGVYSKLMNRWSEIRDARSTEGRSEAYKDANLIAVEHIGWKQTCILWAFFVAIENSQLSEADVLAQFVPSNEPDRILGCPRGY